MDASAAISSTRELKSSQLNSRLRKRFSGSGPVLYGSGRASGATSSVLAGKDSTSVMPPSFLIAAFVAASATESAHLAGNGYLMFIRLRIHRGRRSRLWPPSRLDAQAARL